MAIAVNDAWASLGVEGLADDGVRLVVKFTPATRRTRHPSPFDFDYVVATDAAGMRLAMLGQLFFNDRK